MAFSPGKMPVKYSIQPVAHRKFQELFACRIAIPFDGLYWVVDARGTVDSFKSYDAAQAAGARVLLSIINQRILVPKLGTKPATTGVKGVLHANSPDLEFGFFGAFKAR